MNSDNNNGACLLKAIAAWIKGRQISVYLRGRQKPMTGLTVCGVYPSVLVCRANSSTHLIPGEQIVTVRFMPDSEPGRDVNHPLHSLVAQKGTQPINGCRDVPRGPRDYSKQDPDASPGPYDSPLEALQAILPDVVRDMTKEVTTP